MAALAAVATTKNVEISLLLQFYFVVVYVVGISISLISMKKKHYFGIFTIFYVRFF